MRSAEPRLARRLGLLGLLVGIVPLGLLGLLHGRTQVAEGATVDSGSSLVALSVGLLTLAALTRFFAVPVWRALDRAIGGFRETIGRALENDLLTRAAPGGSVPEIRAFGEALNGLLESRQRGILGLRLEHERALALLKSSRQLIEECIYAREPLAKQHPGLASAYATAAIRQGNDETPTENETIQGLVRGVESPRHGRCYRENLRWTPENVRVELPIPSRLVNMSVSGMAVESDRGLPVGGTWVFSVGTATRAYEIPGRICWCRLERTVKVDDEVRPVYRTGVAFDSVLPGQVFDFFSPGEAPGMRRSESASR